LAEVGAQHRVRWATAALLLAAAYYFGAKLGLALTLSPHPISTLWPPNAILLSALLLSPVRSWPWFVLATFPAHLAVEHAAGIPMPMVLCWFISNWTEAMIGAVAMRRVAALPLRLDTVAETFAFVACVGFLAPFLSSFLDAGFVALNGWGGNDYWTNFRLRFFSNVLANLTLVPVIVTVIAGGTESWRGVSARRSIEAACLALMLVAVCLVVFVTTGAGAHSSPAELYAPLPFLLWAAVRFGPKGLSGAVLIFALLAIAGAIGRHGPFVDQSPAANALSIQLFLIVTSIPLMTLATVMEERRRAVVILQRSEDRLQLAMDAAQLSILEWDIHSNRVEWSGQTEKLIGGASPNEALTLGTLLSFLHADDREAITRAIRCAVEDRAPFELELRLQRESPEARWLVWKGKPSCDESGVPVRIIGVVADVTDRKLAELEAETQRRELAHLGRVALVGELSVAIAHELNQPLGAIMVNARAGQRFLAHDPPDLNQVDEVLQAIVDDDKRARDVILRLRALLLNEKPSREPLDFNGLLQEVAGIARADLTAHGISVVWSLSRSLPQVTADRVQLQQVVLNLVLNACDAMQDEPRGTRRLVLTSERNSDDGVRVRVSDSGHGIRQPNLNQIFEPFVTSKPRGLGLGLAICSSIVSAHGGRLWAENNAVRGATLCLELPASGAQRDSSSQTVA
jgi:two-component system sensor kinase FixL